ncbi:MAG TPA: glycosyltransferase [Dermatophilaceae bacterium]|nr:glycosyltransferase [Dermatophilaceae bacterium]
MRVGYVLKRFPRLSQTFVLTEMLELERRGYELVVFAGRDSAEVLTDPRVAQLNAPVHYVGRDTATAAAAVASLTSSARLAHLHAHFAGWAARTAADAAAQAGVPFSLTAHATDIYRADVDRQALAGLLARAAFVVTVTDDNARELTELVGRRSPGDAQAGRVVRIYNGVDLERLVSGPPASHRRDVVLAVGRLVAKKGFDDLVRAVARLREAGRNVRTTVLGDGPERSPLGALASDLGVADLVTFLGAADPGAVAEWMRTAAVLAVPCVVAADGDRDALPTVVSEAMALGLPVVATDVNGLPEMVQHERTGLVLPQRAPADLADALARLLDDPGQRDRFAAAARARAERLFSLHDNVATLAGLFAGRVEVAPSGDGPPDPGIR